MANAFKTEQVESMDQLSKDKEFCAYVGGIAKRHREKYGSVLYRRIPNNHFDYYQEAWIAICEAWKNKPK